MVYQEQAELHHKVKLLKSLQLLQTAEVVKSQDPAQREERSF